MICVSIRWSKLFVSLTPLSLSRKGTANVENKPVHKHTQLVRKGTLVKKSTDCRFVKHIADLPDGKLSP